MRTIQLTDEQIALIQNALGIAEKSYTKIHSEISELANVRHNELNRSEQTRIGMYYHHQALAFSELNIDICRGTLDVLATRISETEFGIIYDQITE